MHPSGSLRTWASRSIGLAAAAGIAALVGCADAPTTAASAAPAAPTAAELDAQAVAMMRGAFRDQGIAKVDRIQQDEVQAACSSGKALDLDTQERLQAQELAKVKWPTGGRYLGDWREGEKIAQSGRGMTWTDASIEPKANGGSCYNCHQIDPKEISFGTIGPSLVGYGKKRNVTDPTTPAAATAIQHAWAQLYNAKSAHACSPMPRFGVQGLLNEEQMAHLMALLFDPQSPVNR